MYTSPVMTSFRDSLEKESNLDEKTANSFIPCTKPTALSYMWFVAVVLFFIAQVISIFLRAFCPDFWCMGT